MQEPSLPKNEDKRLKALYELELLDTDSNENLDRLTRTTKLTFDVPIALISLIDQNRQWFKSKNGIEFSELPRKTSFCGHAILQDQLFVIPDTWKDERFSDNPLVVNKPNVRFYAGYPISTPENLNVGTLCMLDKKPRRLREREAEIFQNLAQIVEHEINYLKLITIDDVTTTLNHKGFMKSVSKRLNLCQELNLNAVLTLIRLDNLESITYYFSYHQVNQILITFTNLLKQYLDKSDILARLDGGEFAVFSSGKKNEIIRYNLIGFQRKLEEYNRQRNFGDRIQLSYQIVPFHSEQHQSIHELLSSARERLHQS